MRRRIAGREASSSPSEPSARRGGARRIGFQEKPRFPKISVGRKLCHFGCRCADERAIRLPNGSGDFGR